MERSKHLEYALPTANVDFNNKLLTQCPAVCVNQMVLVLNKFSIHVYTYSGRWFYGTQKTPKVKALGIRARGCKQMEECLK